MKTAADGCDSHLIQDTKNERPGHLIYVSSNLPARGFGSSVIVWRHLQRLKGWRISIVVFQGDKKTDDDIPEAWHVIEVSDLKRFISTKITRYDFYLNWKLNRVALGIERELSGHFPTVILSVFGKNTLLASKLSQRWSVPLHILVHDRWQVWANSVFDRIFMTEKRAVDILNRSSGIWPVCEELGSYYPVRNADKIHVLPPIPEGIKSREVPWTRDRVNPFVLSFAGSYHDYMAPTFVSFAKVLHQMGGWLLLILKEKRSTVKVFGGLPGLKKQKPFASNADALEYLQKNSSALLVPYPIETDSDWSGMGFPSKLVEFVHLRLPVIVVSKPGTPLGAWSESHNWTLYLDTLNENDIYNCLLRLKQKAEWQKAVKEAEKIAASMFNPETIHQRLEISLIRGTKNRN